MAVGNRKMTPGRALRGLLAAVLTLASTLPAVAATAAAPAKIGIIGTGHIGGTLAKLWVASGHEVFLSSRHPEQLKALAESLGPKAHVGTPREAAVFGDVVLVSVPYKALPDIGRDLRSELAGKVVLDTCNPYPERDGPMAVEVRKEGTGAASPRFLPGVRLVRAFNAIGWRDLEHEAHRKGELIAIPLAGDDSQALAVAGQLVTDAGFAPVVVGGLERAREFDVGTKPYTRLLTAPELRATLTLK
jgi:8-hydroxy-5-deazaflavin:NADPH oxidoreductase